MKNKLTEFIEYVLASFDNHNKGASGKKLTAFAITIAYCYSHRFIEAVHLAEVLLVDGALIATLFGIGSYDKKLKLNDTTNKEL